MAFDGTNLIWNGNLKPYVSYVQRLFLFYRALEAIKPRTMSFLIKQFLKVSLIFVLIHNFHGGGRAQALKVLPGPITSDISDSRSVNFLDLNNDGWEDLYISNGKEGGQPDLLYLNNGSGEFIKVTDMAIVKASNPSDGASFADYNNDGHIDGIISSWYGAEDLLYLNNGNGNLEYNASAGMVTGSFAETASFGDYDNDGWLDLYVTNSGGGKDNYLYRNLQNGKFERVTDHILVQDTKPSRGAIWGDFNNDGITDLFVANESDVSNDIFLGTGGGNYEKLNRGGIIVKTFGSMTGSWGDIDNDGDLDLFIGNSAFFKGQRNQLYKNFGGSFAEITDDPVVNANTCTFGSAFGDYDNDGDLDLVVTNGFCSSGLRNTLYENQGDGTFVDASDQLGLNASVCSFGVAWGDVNNDGFLDLAVANCKNNNTDTERPNTLMVNQGNDNNWLALKLTGVQSNRSAIGTQVRVKATINGKISWQLREVSAQSGYAGQNSLVVHFGMGDASQIDSLLIRWPAGTQQVLTNVLVNQKLTITEGTTTSNQNQLTSIPGLSMEVFPNPGAAEEVRVRLNFTASLATWGIGTIALYDTLGQSMAQRELKLRKGETIVSIPKPGSRLAAGMYQVVLQIEDRTMTRTVMIRP